ncbi:MAG TPA: DUF1700 domain-containing protein [Clostridia bacterium]|nr:DUF1700 domain-containing protein [Clostridia bacterium]
MNKREFLDALGGRLSQLPRDEIDKQLAYYAELIDDMTEDGMDEAHAVAKLGDPADIAKTVLQDTPLPVLVKSRVKPGGGWTALSIVLLVLGAPVWLPIVLALLAVLLSVYVVIWAVIVVLFATVLAIALSGLAVIFAVFITPVTLPYIVLAFGLGIVLAGLSILAFFGALAAAKGLVKLTALIAKGIKSLFIRKEAAK